MALFRNPWVPPPPPLPLHLRLIKVNFRQKKRRRRLLRLKISSFRDNIQEIQDLDQPPPLHNVHVVNQVAPVVKIFHKVTTGGCSCRYYMVHPKILLQQLLEHIILLQSTKEISSIPCNNFQFDSSGDLFKLAHLGFWINQGGGEGGIFAEMVLLL